MMPEVYVKPVLQGNDYLIFYPVKPGRRQSFIDLHDMTDVACKVIVEGSAHYNASYELCGPDKLTNDDNVRIQSRATGRIGREWCRERVGKWSWILVVGGLLKKKNKEQQKE